MSRRSNPELLDLGNYPRQFSTRALYNDMDAFRHVNNVAIGRWFEEGRADLNMAVFGRSVMVDPAPGQQLLLASTFIEYLAQVNYPGSATVGSAIARIGSSSYVVIHALQHDGRCCAISETVMVKAAGGRPTPVSADERATLESFLFRGPQ